MADDFMQPPSNPEPEQQSPPQPVQPVTPTPPPSLPLDPPVAQANPQMQNTATPTEPVFTPMQEEPKKSNLKKILGLVGGFIFGFLIVGLNLYENEL